MKHLVVRYSDKFGATIALHNEVALLEGSVWFGKMGTGVANRWITMLESQIALGQDSWLYLTCRNGLRYNFHKARILQILKSDLPPTRGLPRYYIDNNLLKQMTCFFRIESLDPCTRSEVLKIRLASSGSPITDVLTSSMAGLFIVE